MAKYNSPFLSLIDQNGSDTSGGYGSTNSGQSSGKSRYISPFMAMADIATKRRKQEEEDIASKAVQDAMTKKQAEEDAKKKEDSKNILQKTGDFIVGVATSIKDDAVNAYTGIKDTIEGSVATDKQSKLQGGLNDIQNKANKQINDIYGKYIDAGKVAKDGGADESQMSKADLDKIIQLKTQRDNDVNKYKKDNNFDAQSAENKKQFDESQKVDAKKTAFAAGSTFLNATGVYGLAGAGVKAVGTQVVKTMAKDAVEQAVKTGGTEMLEQVIKQGSKEVAKDTIEQLTKQVGQKTADGLLKQALKKAAPEALLGAGYGTIETGKQNPDATLGDYLQGAAIGGAIGGAIPLAGAGISKAKSMVVDKMAEKAASKAGAGVTDVVLSDAEKAAVSAGSKSEFVKTQARSDVIANTATKDMVTQLEGAGTKMAGKTEDEIRQAFQTAVNDGTVKLNKQAIKAAQEGASTMYDDAIAKNAMIPTAEDKIVTSGMKAKWNNVFAPVRNLADETQAAFKKRAGSEYSSKVEANIMERNITSLAKKEGITLDMNTVHQIESGTMKGEFADAVRARLDAARQAGIDAGADIGYRENYLPHIWKQSTEEVQKIAKQKGFQLKALAEGKRVVPTYEEGLQLGLTPKHTNPAKMVADYMQNVNRATGNVQLFSDLKEQGLLATGKTPHGWKMITAEGFPKDYRGAPMSAPPEVANVINNIFGKDENIVLQGLRKTAHFNSMWQDIALAGGIPHTPANFFTFSQMMKEGALGAGQFVTGQPIRGIKTIYSPLATFVRSFSDKQTTKFLSANENFIKRLAENGVPINFAEASDKGFLKNAVTWDKMFNEPTFGRFMPAMQVSTAKNVYNSLARKMGSEEAMKVTAEVTKKLYGITDQMATGRAQGLQDLIGTVAFAPKYRESIINVLTNTLKSLSPTTWKDSSYSLNRRLAVGMGITYLAYNELNKAMTGHGMNENAKGKELQLAIPYGGKDDKGNQKVIYIPFMPSFLTIPRAGIDIATGAAEGDQKRVLKGAGAFASMPIQTMSALANNKDYFDNPIYIDEKTSQLTKKEADTPEQAFKKQAMYVLGQSSPAAVRAGIGVMQGKPAEQNIATAAEAPVRFGELSSASTKDKSYAPSEVNNEFYKVYNPMNAKKRTASAEVTSLIKQGKTAEAKRRAEEFNASLVGKFGDVHEKFGGTKAWNADWNDMMQGLMIPTTPRAFKARAKS